MGATQGIMVRTMVQQTLAVPVMQGALVLMAPQAVMMQHMVQGAPVAPVILVAFLPPMAQQEIMERPMVQITWKVPEMSRVLPVITLQLVVLRAFALPVMLPPMHLLKIMMRTMVLPTLVEPVVLFVPPMVLQVVLRQLPVSSARVVAVTPRTVSLRTCLMTLSGRIQIHLAVLLTLWERGNA